MSFRASNGHWRKRDLFVDVIRHFAETDRGLPEEFAPYWLNKKLDPQDKRPILRDLFIEAGDPVGVKFAKKYLGGWDHFQALLKCTWFSKVYQEWQIELRANIKANALQKIQEISEEGSAQSLAAAKYLANGEYTEEGKASAKRGRPSKEEVQGELKRQVKALTQAEEDFNRMTQFAVINGGKK